MEKHMLVVYYSWSNGNTEKVAQRLAEACGADIERIETVEQGQREVNEGFKPRIKLLEHDFASYDVIAVGTPTWWYTMAPAVRALLAENDVHGKKVVAFQTNGGWPGSVIGDIEGACEGAEFGPSLEIQFDSNGGDVQKTPQGQVDAWVEEVRAYANNCPAF